MKGQQGSVLAGVIGVAVGITTAVAGFAVLSGNSGRIVGDTQSDLQLHYAAEAGIYMGLRWLRTYPESVTKDTTWPMSPITLNSVSGDFSDFEGINVKVRFFKSPGEYQKKKLQCLATAGPGRDTLEINLYFASTQVTAIEDYNGTQLYGLNLARWTETLRPAF